MICVLWLVTQSCPTLSNPMACSPPGSSIHGILQARTLEWVAISFSRRSSQPRDQTQDSHIAGRFFTSWAIRDAQECWSGYPVSSPGELPNNNVLVWLCAMCAKSLQSCLTLCDPIDCSPPGSSVHGILQARMGVGCHALLQCMAMCTYRFIFKIDLREFPGSPVVQIPQFHCRGPRFNPWSGS